MKTIYKYWLKLVDEQTISLPQHSVVLSAITQPDMIVVYVLADYTITKIHDATIRIVRTGHHFADCEKFRHLATVTTSNDRFVWHVFVEAEQ